MLRQSNKQQQQKEQKKKREIIPITKSMLSNGRIKMKLDDTLNRRVKAKTQLASS